MERSFLSVSLALVVLAAGCAPVVNGAPSPFDDAASRRETTAMDVMVEVRNQHWLPMRVWVEWPTMARFLGDVAPGGSAAFSVPGYLVQRMGGMRLHAETRGSIDEVLTEPIDMGGGRRVEWTLRKVLGNSRPRII